MKSRLPKLFLMLFLLSGWMEGSARKQPGKEMLLPMAQTERVYTEETRVEKVKNDPVFGAYGRLLFPVQEGYMSGSTLGTLDFAWYSNVRADETIAVLNDLHEQAEKGETIFFDIYSEAEKERDPHKKDTGLFFFRGKPGAKTAFVNAGGGFAYVAALHDSFPQAMALARKGYNAFCLIYRPDAQSAAEDLARAIAFVFDHARELEVDPEDYSLWGGSAGARMANWLGTYGTAYFDAQDEPGPAAVIMQYTGESEVTGAEPPTFAVVGTRDWIASWRVMQERVQALQAAGIPAEIRIYKGLQHGFGLGKGTSAEGWLEEAVAFWQQEIDSHEKE